MPWLSESYGDQVFSSLQKVLGIADTLRTPRRWQLLAVAGKSSAGWRMLCLNPKGNLHFPSEGITPVACVATMLGYKCLNYETLREDTILGIYEGHSQANLYQVHERTGGKGNSRSQMVPSKMVQCLWEPQKLCTTHRNHQDFPTLCPD